MKGIALEDMAILEIDPEYARVLLSKNTNNRNIRRGHVDALAHMMRQGQWHIGADAICVSADGTLLNGQHRLNAVIVSGCTVSMMVRFGVDPSEMIAMDGGAKRTTADHLAFAGEVNSAKAAAIARLAIQFGVGDFDGDRNAPSNQDIVDFVLSRKEQMQETVKVATGTYEALRVPPSIAGAAHMVIVDGGNPIDEVTRWFELLDRPIGLAEDSSVYALITRLRGAAARKGTTKKSFVAMFVRGWNLYVRDIPVRRIVINGDQIPAVEKFGQAA